MKKIIKKILITILILLALFIIFKPQNVFLFDSGDHIDMETNEDYE